MQIQTQIPQEGKIIGRLSDSAANRLQTLLNAHKSTFRNEAGTRNTIEAEIEGLYLSFAQRKQAAKKIANYYISIFQTPIAE